jgi:hypothetical protein
MSTLVEIQHRPSARRRWGRALLYVVAVALTGFMLLPIYLIAIAAFSTRAAVSAFPKPLFPQPFSIDTMRFFLTSTGVANAPAARASPRDRACSGQAAGRRPGAARAAQRRSPR